jgi:hypothetical protein
MIATLIDDDGGPDRDKVATVMLLLAFGRAGAEARAIANRPLLRPME